MNKIPEEVLEALWAALADIQEGVVSFKADEYEPIIREWLDMREAKGAQDE